MALIIGLSLVASWRWVLGRPPAQNAKPEVKLAFLESGAYLVAGALFMLVIAAIGAVVLARAARKEYAELLDSNLKDLVTETQEAIRRKQSDA